MAYREFQGDMLLALYAAPRNAWAPSRMIRIRIVLVLLQRGMRDGYIAALTPRAETLRRN